MTKTEERLNELSKLIQRDEAMTPNERKAGVLVIAIAGGMILALERIADALERR